MELSQRLAPVERAAMASGEPVRAVMEATSNSRAVAGLLKRWGQEAGIDLTVDVLAPRKLRIIAESVNKCDRLDAQVLLDLASSNLRLPVCHVPDDETFALREHLRARSDLVKVQTMVKNRVQAALHRRGVLRPQKMDLFTKQGRTYLRQLDLDEAGRSVIDRYLGALDRLHELLLASNRELSALAKSDHWRASTALARTMPGVGPVTALTVLAELGDVSRFSSRAAVSNYASLIPVTRRSNQTAHYGKLVRGGNARLRGVLVEAAWRAITKVPAYDAIYQRVSARRGKAKAIVAVARRMLEDLWTMLKRGEPFRYARPIHGSGDAIGRAG